MLDPVGPNLDPTRQPVSQSSFDECPGVTGTLVPQCVGNQSAQSATRHPFSQSPFAGGFNVKGSLAPQSVGTHSAQSLSRQPVSQSPFDECLGVEDLAAAMPRPTAEELLSMVDQLPCEQSGNVLWSGNSHSWQSGAWGSGKLCGLRASTTQFPKFTSLVCRFIYAILPTFCFTAFAFLRNASANKQVDCSYIPGTLHLVIPLGSFTGGDIVVATHPPTRLLVCESPVFLDPSLRYWVDKWQGSRDVLVAYSPNHFEELSHTDQQALVRLGFRPPAASPDNKLAMGPVPKIASPPPRQEPLCAAIPCAPDAGDRFTRAASQATQALFLEMCAGAEAPLSKAMAALGIHCVSVDILLCPEQDLLQDACFESLLRLAFSGAIRFAHGSLHGLECNDSRMQEPADQSRCRLERCAHVLLATFQAGGHCSLEQPTHSLAWEDPIVTAYVKEIQADLIISSACRWGMDSLHHWLFAASWRPLQSLQSLCEHQKDFHVPRVGIRDSVGGFESQDAAVFPAALVEEFARCVSPLFDASPTSQGSFMGVSEALRGLPIRPAQDFPTATQDGGGIYSVPDWTTPQWSGPDIFKKLRGDLLDFFAKRRHVARLRKHVREASSQPLFLEEEVDQLRGLWESWFRDQGPALFRGTLSRVSLTAWMRFRC